jgi:hypothetical protein
MDGMKLMESMMLMSMEIVIVIAMVMVMVMVTVVRTRTRKKRRKRVKIQGGASCCCLPLYLPRGCSASTRRTSRILRVLVGLQVYSLPHFRSHLPTR